MRRLVLWFATLVTACAFLGLVACRCAHAESKIQYCDGAWCVQPASAIGWVVNVQTGDVAQANVLLGASVVRNGAIPLGVGVYGGSVFSLGAVRPTLCALFSVANFAAAGPGVLMFKDEGRVIYQATLNLSLNLNYGGP